MRVVFVGINRAAAASMPQLYAGNGTVHDALALTPPAVLFLAVIVTLLVLSDVRALRERAFLANLGVGLRMVAATSFGLTLACEALFGAVLGIAA